MGIKGRLITLVAIMSLLAIAGIGVASYKYSSVHAIEEGQDKGNLIFNYIMAQRDYFREEQRSIALEIVEHDRFYPSLMSGFAVTRGTWDKVKKNLPGYMFKQATLDPLHPANKADADEVTIIDVFRADKSLKRHEGLINKGGEEYYFIATPIKVIKKGCLRCHGNPEDAPKDQLEIYGEEHGYNWKMNETVATFIVYVSIKKAMEQAKETTMVLVMIGAITILLLVVMIWLFISQSVVNPILILSEKAEKVSLGKNLQENITHKRDDEIGHLASAINRLRISMVKILKRSAKK